MNTTPAPRKRLDSLLLTPWRWLFFPLWLIYRPLVAINSFLYNAGLRNIKKLPCPVIAVGNISVGGTGKTPVVDFLTRYFTAQTSRINARVQSHRRQRPK